MFNHAMFNHAMFNRSIFSSFGGCSGHPSLFSLSGGKGGAGKKGQNHWDWTLVHPITQLL